MIDPNFLLLAGGMVASGGVAWGGAAVSLKDVRREQVAVKEALAVHTASDLKVQLDLVDRLARIETKLDALTKK